MYCSLFSNGIATRDVNSKTKQNFFSTKMLFGNFNQKTWTLNMKSFFSKQTLLFLKNKFSKKCYFWSKEQNKIFCLKIVNSFEERTNTAESYFCWRVSPVPLATDLVLCHLILTICIINSDHPLFAKYDKLFEYFQEKF